MKQGQKRRSKPNSIPYYIEEVVRYGSEYESGYGIKNGYPPVMLEMQLAILISVRAIRYSFGLMTGLLIYKLLFG